jgi:hypothetical protein
VAAANVTLVVSASEAQVLQQHVADAQLVVVSNIQQVQPDAPGYQQRRGLLFVGSFDHTPNQQALQYLLQEVLPAVEEALPPQYRWGSGHGHAASMLLA